MAHGPEGRRISLHLLRSQHGSGNELKLTSNAIFVQCLGLQAQIRLTWLPEGILRGKMGVRGIKISKASDSTCNLEDVFCSG